MLVPFFQVDSFTNTAFAGNPAGVVLLDEWLDDATLTQIAAEVNLSETAFVVPEGEQLRIRWFTPTVEVDLCGHATLAAAHIYFTECAHDQRDEIDCVEFQSLSGPLYVNSFSQQQEASAGAPAYGMSLPVLGQQVVAKDQWPEALFEGLGIDATQVQTVLSGRDITVVLENQSQVTNIQPKFDVLMEVDAMCIIPTAIGDHDDFVCRVFAPSAGLGEDPVTGSAYCSLGPYWQSVYPDKTLLTSQQLSERGGQLSIEVMGDKVMLGASAVTVIRGEMEVA